MITRVRMIWCSYKNSQLTFRSEQRERTPKQKSRESMEIPDLNRMEKGNKAHPQHTHYTQNPTLLWWVHVQPGLKSNHSGNSRWGYSPYKQAFFIMFSQQSTTSSVFFFFSRGLCSIEQLPSTDHERCFQWIGMNTSLHNTKGWTGREFGGSRMVGVDSLGRAGSSYHTATMAASRNILLVHYG